MSSSKKQWVATCKACGTDNHVSANKCNGCGRSLHGMFGAGFYKRWICPNCRQFNIADNRKCLCGYSESSGGWIIFIIIIIFIFLISV